MSLDELADLPFITYNPSRYFCAYFKDETMEAKVSIFNSGKMIAVGAKSEKSAKRDLMHVSQVLNELKMTKKINPEITVQNVVIIVELNTRLNLEEMSDLVPGLVYEPEQFPGAIFRPSSFDVVATLFGSGKIIIAGIKSTGDINTVVVSTLEELNLVN